MTTLSKLTFKKLVIALADVKAATELDAALTSRSILSKRTLKILNIALASDKAYQEVVKALANTSSTRTVLSKKAAAHVALLFVDKKAIAEFAAYL